MIIEIVDKAGQVITKVANVSKPEREVAAYGGADWRPYQPSEGELTKRVHRQKLAEIEREVAERLEAVEPGASRLVPVLEVLGDLLNITGPGAAKFERLKNIAAHGKARKQWAEQADRGALNSYDAPSDDWP